MFVDKLKRLGVGGAIVVVLTGFILRYRELISNDALRWALVAIAMLLLAFTAGMGTIYFCLDQTSTHKPTGISADLERRDEHRSCDRIGAIVACCSFWSLGGVLILADLDTRHFAVLAIAWFWGGVVAGLLSPYIYRFIFERFMPWWTNKTMSKGVKITRDPDTLRITGVKDEDAPPGNDQTQAVVDRDTLARFKDSTSPRGSETPPPAATESDGVKP